MERIIYSAIIVISSLVANTAYAQYPTVPNNIYDIEEREGHGWIVASNNATYISYVGGENSYEITSHYDNDNYINEAAKGFVFDGVKIGNYIYDYDDSGYDMVYVYNATECKPVTRSKYIPLKYGNAKGVKFSNGITMYIVPFKAGKFSITGETNKKRLAGTYALILEGKNINHHSWWTAMVNIRKTNNGYDLSKAYVLHNKRYKFNNMVSKNGNLLKNAEATTYSGEGSLVCEPEWIVEYPGLYDGGSPIGVIAK